MRYQMATHLNHCPCGGTPELCHERMGEDFEDAWVECPRCHRATDPVEGTYADFDTAEWLWQSGKAVLPSSDIK